MVEKMLLNNFSTTKFFNSDKDLINELLPYSLTCEERKLSCGPRLEVPSNHNIFHKV